MQVITQYSPTSYILSQIWIICLVLHLQKLLTLNSSFSLVLIKQHYMNSYVQGQLLHECVHGSGCLAPYILNFGTIIDCGEVCILYLDNF